MSSDSLRGTRLGSESFELTSGVNLSPRQTIAYLCPNDHQTEIIFAAEVDIPTTWDCKKCSKTAQLLNPGDQSYPKAPEKVTRTHFDFLLERRSRAELEVILQEALDDLHKRRKEAS